LYFHPHVTLKKEVEGILLKDAPEIKAVMTNIPFFKNNELNYTDLLTSIDPSLAHLGWLIFIPVVIFIVTAVSNGANLTDGIDGLAAGSSAIIMLALLVMAWVSGNFLFADYLNIFYLPKVGEVVVFSGAFIGALIGFMWYNTYPAQVFMGDTGSLTIGGVIAVIAIIVRKELLVPVLCGIFFAESLSVMIQVGYFKYSRKKFGTGRRIFLMAPLHHHYQKKGYHESKIVMRFLIVGILLAVLSIVTLKIR
jgi:phospho-N-acetylmuramoyl-pentapeptide-transferase